MYYSHQNSNNNNNRRSVSTSANNLTAQKSKTCNNNNNNMASTSQIKFNYSNIHNKHNNITNKNTKNNKAANKEQQQKNSNDTDNDASIIENMEEEKSNGKRKISDEPDLSASYLDEIIEQEEDNDNDDFTVVSKKIKKTKLNENNNNSSLRNINNNRNKLPAIKIMISQICIAQFVNCVQIQKEIKRCFNTTKLIIKFAEIAKYNKRILVIATDDELTHNQLKNRDNWPNDAFGKGIKIVEKNSPLGNSQRGQVTFEFSISKVPLDISTHDLLNEIKPLGFNKVVRTIKKENNTPSHFIRLTTEHKEVFDRYMYKREPIFICYSRFYAIPETRPLQCHNCQGLGHKAFDCPKNEPVCLQCAGNHRVKSCTHFDKEKNTYTKTYCINCNTDEHNSCSRKCEAIKTHVKEKISLKKEKLAPKQNPLTATKDSVTGAYKPTFQTTQQPKTYSSAVTNSTNKKHLQREVDVEALVKLVSNLINFIKKTTSSKSDLEELKKIVPQNIYNV